MAASSAPAPARQEPGWGSLLRLVTARVLLTLAASLLLFSVVPVALHWTPRVIMSGSMEPRIAPGDVVVTRKVSAASLAKGQVVTVADPDHPGRTRTHRFERLDSQGAVVTRGDANPQADSSHVAQDRVLGLGVIRVPYVGRPVFWLAEGNWFALSLTLLVGTWAITTVVAGTPGKRHRRPRPPASRGARAGAVLATAAVLVGAGAPSADAAFKTTATNTGSTLSAAADFYPYRTTVLADTPYLYWRLDATSGTAVDDSGSSNRDGTLLASSATLGQAGALTAEPRSTSLGLTQAAVTANGSSAALGTFSVEAWIKTTSTSGGRILGFGNGSGANASSSVDRQLYLGSNGKAYFGVGSNKVTVASSSKVNNGAWHHVVGTYTSGKNGMKLYVDGTLQGSGTATVTSTTGYWRAGAEGMSGWASNPDQYFEGNLDELAVYSKSLSASRVRAHYDAAG